MVDSPHQYEVGDEFPIDDDVKNKKLSPTIPHQSHQNTDPSNLLLAPPKNNALKFPTHQIEVMAQFLGLGVVLIKYGWPGDAWTWACLSIYCAVLTLSWLTHASRLNWAKNLITGFFLLSLFVPYQDNEIQDLRGGRWGTIILPWQLKFGRNGENTEFLENHLGPLKPELRFKLNRSKVFSRSLENPEQVNSRSLIVSRRLEDILRRLPDRAACDQVLNCLTEPNNLLRVHQSMLLTALDAKGFPKGYDKWSWWQAHRWIFVVEKSGLRAAYITYEWLDRCASYLVWDSGGRYPKRFYALAMQIQAARYQKWGKRGGDLAFRKGAFFMANLKAENIEMDRSVLTSLDIEFAGKSVIWWR